MYKILALSSNKCHGVTDNVLAHLRVPNPLAPLAGIWGPPDIHRGAPHPPHTTHSFLYESSAI